MMKTPSRVAAACVLTILCSIPLVDMAGSASAATQQVVLKRAVKEYSDAFLDGRGAAAYKMLSPRCKTKIDRDDFIAASDMAKDIYGGPMRFKSYRAVIDGRKAKATYTYEASALNQRNEPWLKVSGRWRMNEC